MNGNGSVVDDEENIRRRTYLWHQGAVPSNHRGWWSLRGGLSVPLGLGRNSR